MSKFSRSLLVVSAGALLLGMSGCALPGVSGDSDAAEQSGEPQSQGLKTFDPCSFFESDELKSWGLPSKGEDATKVSWEPTCRWSGDSATFDFTKNEEETVDSYENSGSWESYEKKSIAGRPGALGIVRGGSGSGGCDALVSAGNGVVIYHINSDSGDACGEATKIAESTASRLPA